MRKADIATTESQHQKRHDGWHKSGDNPDRSPDDFYETPPEATRTLLAHEPIGDNVWECASGKGAISRVLEHAGRSVVSTDLRAERYGFGKPCDFLKATPELYKTYRCQDIVTNPPFEFLTEFIQQGISLQPQRLALHVPVNALFKVSRRRVMELTQFPARVLVFVPSLKVDMKHDGKPTTSMFNHCWAIWYPREELTRPTELVWVNWRQYL